MGHPGGRTRGSTAWQDWPGLLGAALGGNPGGKAGVVGVPAAAAVMQAAPVTNTGNAVQTKRPQAPGKHCGFCNADGHQEDDCYKKAHGLGPTYIMTPQDYQNMQQWKEARHQQRQDAADGGPEGAILHTPGVPGGGPHPRHGTPRG